MNKEYILTAKQAYDGIKNSELILIDIRENEEFKQTGVAKGSYNVSISNPEFLTILDKLILENKGMKIAIICAAGGRSSKVRNILSEKGHNNIYDVAEGMTGGIHGKGWLANGLNVIDFED